MWKTTPRYYSIVARDLTFLADDHANSPALKKQK
jgi:hypothetical protein